MSQNDKVKKIFRDKALERVSSPEQLNDYIRVVNVGIWVILGALLALILGAVIWCSVITLETDSVDAAAVVKNGEVCLYFCADSREQVKAGMDLNIGQSEFIMPDVEIKSVKLFHQTDSAIMELLGTDGTGYVYCAEFWADIPNGVYPAGIVTSDISPFELLFN